MQYSSVDTAFFSFLADIPPVVGGVVAVLLGLVWGSFITMLSYRLPRGEDVVFKASHCPRCAHRLGFFDLIPLCSWLINKGACRYCCAKISIRYPLIEATLALLFLQVYSQFGLSLQALLLALVAAFLLLIIITDLEHYIIPDKAQLLLLVLAFPYAWVRDVAIWPLLLGAVVGGLTGVALRSLGRVWKKREALGWGDVKFLVVVGLYLGIAPLPVFFFLAGVAGIATGMVWRLMGRGVMFPFAPALVMALWLLLVFPSWQESFLLPFTFLINR